MSKKVLSVLMSLIVGISLIGCNNKTSSMQKDTDGNVKVSENNEQNKNAVDDVSLEGTWAQNRTLDEIKKNYSDYLKKMEDITKELGLKYSKDQKIKENQGETVNEQWLYFDNEKPENNKIESMYFGMKIYGKDSSSGDITLKMSLKFDGEGAIKNNDFNLGQTTFAKYIKAFTGDEQINYSDISKQIVDGLKNGKNEVHITSNVDGLKEEILASKNYIIYTLSTKKYVFSDAEMSVN